MSKLPPIDTVANNLYEAAARSRNDQPRRNYLGMSAIGDPCERKLWFGFRGFTPLPLDGRVIMLFRFGDRVEEEVIHWLRAAGYHVEGQQEGFSDHGGWFSGHCDGIIHGITNQPHILEIKSCNAKKFNAFKKYGVQKTYQIYWDQSQCYMGYAGLERALFVIQNKDNSEIYTERVYFDQEAFTLLRKKAFSVITSNDPIKPEFAKDSQTCSWCDHRITCWNPEESIQTLQDCMTCQDMRWDGLKRFCHNPEHAFELVQRNGACPDWKGRI